MLGNNTYKEFARWREHWMAIMSPKSANFSLSPLKPDQRPPLAFKEARFRQQSREMSQTRTIRESSQSDSTDLKVSSEPEQTGLETSIWED